MRHLALILVAGCIPPTSWGSAYNWVGNLTPTEHVAPPAPYQPAPVGGAPTGSFVIYIHGGGARLTGGTDDAPNWVSRTVEFHGLAYADVPAFEGTQDEWTEMMACTQRYFSFLPISIVDRQPTSGDYQLLVVGGNDYNIDATNAWGEASTGAGTPVPRGTGFAFSAAHQTDHRAQRLCETVSHEIGHMLGLAHSDNCQDLMSNSPPCTWTGARPGFTESREQLIRALAPWTAPALAPSALRPVSHPVIAQTEGWPHVWPIELATTRPMARAMVRYMTPAGLRGEWNCLVENGCIESSGLVMRTKLPTTESGTWQTQIEVTYTDGSTELSDWFATTL